MNQKTCPACGRGIDILPAMAGRSIECPHCHERLKVPAAKPPPFPARHTSDAKPPANDDTRSPGPACAGPPRADVPDAGHEMVIHPQGATAGAARYRRRKKSRWGPALLGLLVVACFALIATVPVVLREKPTAAGPVAPTVPVAPAEHTAERIQAAADQPTTDRNRPPRLKLPSDLTVSVGQTLRARLEAEDPDPQQSPLQFVLVRGPAGAALDSDSGELVWTPPADTPAGTAAFLVRVRQTGQRELAADGQLRVAVTVPETPVDAVIRQLREQAKHVRKESGTFEHSFGGVPGVLQIDGEDVRYFEYADDAETRADAIRIAKDRAAMQMPELPPNWVGPTRYFRGDRLLLVYAGLDERLVATLTGILGDPLDAARPARSATTD